MLTATPHSGKPEEFHSLPGLLKPEFETLDVANSSQAERRELAKYFIQRKRADVEKWMGEDTPFPQRDPGEIDYKLSKNYAVLFDPILDFARKLVTPDKLEGTRQKRLHYWTALGLLRGVMSSPAAGIAMLQNRMSNLEVVDGDSTTDDEDDPIHDIDYGYESDLAPAHVVDQAEWSEYQRKQLRGFANQLEELKNPAADQKLAYSAMIVDDWLKDGLNDVKVVLTGLVRRPLGRAKVALFELIELFCEGRICFTVVSTNRFPRDQSRRVSR